MKAYKDLTSVLGGVVTPQLNHQKDCTICFLFVLLTFKTVIFKDSTNCNQTV